MHDPLRGKAVERLAVAGAGARRARRFGRRAAAAAGRAALRRRAGCRRRPAGSRACRSRSRWSNRAGSPASSSVARTVTTIAGLTGSKPNSSSRRQLHPHRCARLLNGDHRGIGRRVVGAVMAVAARALHMLAPRSRRDRASACGPMPRAADRRPAYASRPGVARRARAPARRTAPIEAWATCIRREGRLVRSRLQPGRSVAARPTIRSTEGCCNSQRASSCDGLIGSMPSQVTWPGATAAAASTAVSSAPRIAMKLPWRMISIGPLAARRIAASSMVADPAATARLAHDARMHHAVEHHVVDENRLAEDFVGEVDARPRSGRRRGNRSPSWLATPAVAGRVRSTPSASDQ